MSYGIILSDEARQDLAALPVEVRRQAMLRLRDDLAPSPGSVSVRSHFPYREKCQLYKFRCEEPDGGDDWELTVHFQYSQDETSLHVIAIGRSRRPPRGNDE